MFFSTPLLSDADQLKIKSAIREAEQQTSGEIRVFVESGCKGEILDRAAFLFQQLEMHKTKLRNGVLFYLAIKEKRFAILGDGGINSKTGPHFWDEIRIVMENNFKSGQFSAGLEKGILMAGEALRKNFPFRKDDKNELSDDIVFGK